MLRIIEEDISAASFTPEDPILFGNVELRDDRAYFIYVGELRAYGLNRFLVPCLERMYGRAVDCVAFIPDVLSNYNDHNLVVLNEDSYKWRSRKNWLVNCRPSAGHFAHQVSSSGIVRGLLDRILRNQDLVYIYMFESRPELTLPDGERIVLLGPKPSLAQRFNNKILQYQMACKLGIPVAEGVCCECLEEALDVAQGFFRNREQIFISESYSAAGSNSAFASSCEEVWQRFSKRDQPYLVTRRIPHSRDPTALAVVANDQEVYVASVADQMMDNNKFLGSSFPTELDGDLVAQIRHYTRLVGQYMGASGYRGMFGCDFIVDDQNNVYFVEVNARKQGTTLESTLTIRQRFPGHPSLPEIEFQAVTEGRLRGDLKELDASEAGLCWGTYNVKCQHDSVITRGLCRTSTETELFRKVHEESSYPGGVIVEDYLGAGIYQRAGGFVGRCISVGKNLSEVRRLLKEKADEVTSSTRLWDER